MWVCVRNLKTEGERTVSVLEDLGVGLGWTRRERP